VTVTDRMETVGIIGAGHANPALARTALRAGRQVVIANSGGPRSLAPVVVASLGEAVSPGTVPEAAALKMVDLAVPRANVPASVGARLVKGANTLA
jgi:predicted dinucleotide-binding enzyme